MSEKEEFRIPTPEEARAAAAEKLKPEVIKLIKEFKTRLEYWDGKSEIVVSKNQINDLVNQEFLTHFRETNWIYSSETRKDSDMRGDSWDVQVFVFRTRS